VLAKGFGVNADYFGHTPDPEQRYIFPLPVPGPLASDRFPGNGDVPDSFSYRVPVQAPAR
jgi:oxalate decarboxylase